MSMGQSLPSEHTASQRLIFGWPERSASFVLPSLFLASVAAHALTFYIFQVVYPPTVSMTPPPAQVTLLTPSTPESEALLRWVDEQSLAATAVIEDVTPAGLGEVRYVPSYGTIHALPKLVETPPEPAAFPPGRDPLAVTAAPVAHGEVPRTAAHSSLRLFGSLHERDAAPQEAVTIAATSKSNSLQITRFLAGISDRGEVQYCFLQASSGDRTIDEQAEAQLRQHAFKRTDTPAPVAWGFATFTWGVEAFASTQAPENYK